MFCSCSSSEAVSVSSSEAYFSLNLISLIFFAFNKVNVAARDNGFFSVAENLKRSGLCNSVDYPSNLFGGL